MTLNIFKDSMMVSYVNFIIVELTKVYEIVLMCIKQKLLIFDIIKLTKVSVFILIIQLFKFKKALGKFVQKKKHLTSTITSFFALSSQN